MSVEQRKFERLVQAIARDIRKLAASCEGEFSKYGLSAKVIRAIDRAYSLGRFQNDPLTAYCQIEGLNAARQFACRQSGLNLRNARYAEMARIHVIIREKRIVARINNGW